MISSYQKQTNQKSLLLW